MKTYFNWSPEGQSAMCKIIYKGNAFIGSAHCHEEDLDFMSEMTGCTIAEARAHIKMLQHIKNNELKPTLATLNHIMASFESSERYDRHNPEYKFIWRQINDTTEKLDIIRTEIKESKENLKKYIDGKEAIYKKLRQDKSN